MITQELREQLDELPENIKEKKVEWASLILKRGVIVDLHIGRTRFIRKMTKEDLGLDIPDQEFQRFVTEYYDLGSKLLIPKRISQIFNKIEGRARGNLYRHSFSTPFGLFVPYTAYNSWKEENEKHKDTYLKEKEKLMSELPLLKDEIIQEYRGAAEKLYERTDKNKSLEQFIDDFITNLSSQLPDTDAIKKTFHYGEDIYYIPLPSEVEEELLKAEIIHRETTVERARTQAEINKVAAEIQMKRDAYEKIIENKKQKIDSLVDSISGELRGAIYTTLKDVLESLQTKSALTPGSVKSLRKLVEKTRLMNFLDDQKIEDSLSEIERVFSQRSEDRSLKDMSSVFYGIAQEFRAYALEKDELPEIRDFLL